MRFAEVAVDFPDDRDRTFTYGIPGGVEAEPGDVVWVPFGPQTRQGVVFSITTNPPDIEDVRPILHVASGGPFVSSSRLEVARWVAGHYRTTLFNAVSLMLPPGASSRLRTWISVSPSVTDHQLAQLSPRESRAVTFCRRQGARIRRDRLARRLGRGGETVVDRLARQGVFRATAEWERARVQAVVREIAELGIAAGDAKSVAEPFRHGRQRRRSELIDWLVEGGRGTRSELAERFGQAATKWAIDSEVATIVTEQVERDPLRDFVVQVSFPLDPTPEQAGALQAINSELERAAGGHAGPPLRRQGQGPAAFLLFGVTGSGKTEVYLQAAAKCIALGRRVLILVPEIALTPQTLRRFASRFPGRVALLHSGLTAGERFDQWWRISEGAYDIVLGSRGAVFAPIENVGLVILDEEHEWTYKQHDQSPRYHARDVAERLCGETGAALVLGSATPDIGTFRRAERGEIRLLRLSRRIGSDGQSMAGREAAGRAAVTLVDMRDELRHGHVHMLGRPLIDAMKAALDADQRVILFLNRRGTAAFVQCADCGAIRNCRRCDAALTFHEASRKGERSRLECHYCGYSVQSGKACPACGGRQVRRHGPGTQAVEAAVREFFPDTVTLRWDSDAARSARDHLRIMREFEDGDARVLVGTQMIAKGLDIPTVTLVGVVSADTGLAIPDFRAAERAFQVLAQVAGRAGRGAKPGRVIIQTFQPDHYAVVAAASQDYEAFYETEIAFRAEYNNPPFSRLVRLLHSGPDAQETQEGARAYSSALRDERRRSGDTGVEVFGPTPSFPFRLRGMYRWHILLRGAIPETLLDKVPPGRGWAIDVDPVSTT